MLIELLTNKFDVEIGRDFQRKSRVDRLIDLEIRSTKFLQRKFSFRIERKSFSSPKTR